MADVHSKETRSYNMSRIRGKDTKPEMLVRRFLHKSGFRYRLHVKGLPGKPDIVLPKYKTVIFVHGCFWHGHEGCKYASIPKTRTQWWSDKIARNKYLDTNSKISLELKGWKVIAVFTCDLKNKTIISTFDSLISSLNLYLLK
ncbi:MAG TPA: DNA mismatch endonuclease Vsr [Mucilaginibacter sp.]|jgi:DNA mismatch endonuclease (patch repair protein)